MNSSVLVLFFAALFITVVMVAFAVFFSGKKMVGMALGALSAIILFILIQFTSGL